MNSAVSDISILSGWFRKPRTEVSSREGHIGGLFIMKEIPKDLSAAKTVDLIHKAGGMAVAHHPYSPKFVDFIQNNKGW